MTKMTDLLCYLIFTAVTLLLVGYKSTSGSTSVIFGCIFFLLRTVNISAQIRGGVLVISYDV